MRVFPHARMTERELQFWPPSAVRVDEVTGNQNADELCGKVIDTLATYTHFARVSCVPIALSLVLHTLREDWHVLSCW